MRRIICLSSISFCRSLIIWSLVWWDCYRRSATQVWWFSSLTATMITKLFVSRPNCCFCCAATFWASFFGWWMRSIYGGICLSDVKLYKRICHWNSSVIRKKNCYSVFCPSILPRRCRKTSNRWSRRSWSCRIVRKSKYWEWISVLILIRNNIIVCTKKIFFISVSADWCQTIPSGNGLRLSKFIDVILRTRKRTEMTPKNSSKSHYYTLANSMRRSTPKCRYCMPMLYAIRPWHRVCPCEL